MGLNRKRLNEMRKITINKKITTVCPDLLIAAIGCEVKNSSNHTALWEEIDKFCTQFSINYKLEDINQFPAIYATRQVYKKLGKDPNRYRPSAEALCRRILKGQKLYQINLLVDLINLLSLKTGYSIGGFDDEKIQGDLILGVGKQGELFDAIGRGELNIEGLPVYRDTKGGIGTPTSDEERTKITSNTTHLLMLINGYSGKDGLVEAVQYAEGLLKKYGNAKNIEISILNKDGDSCNY